MTYRAFVKHFWRTREVVTEAGVMPCACSWWKRLYFLLTYR